MTIICKKHGAEPWPGAYDECPICLKIEAGNAALEAAAVKFESNWDDNDPWSTKALMQHIASRLRKMKPK